MWQRVLQSQMLLRVRCWPFPGPDHTFSSVWMHCLSETHFRKSPAGTQVPYHGPQMTLALRNSGVGCSSMTRVTSGCISWSCAFSVWLWHLSSLVPFQLPCQSASLWDRTVRMTMSSAAPAICKSARRIFCTNWIWALCPVNLCPIEYCSQSSRLLYTWPFVILPTLSAKLETN